MLIVIGAFSLASLVLNILIFRKMKAAEAVVVWETLPVELAETEERVAEPEDTVLPPAPVPVFQEVYQGWRNQRDIPWNDIPAPTPAPSNPPTSGPLERPGGFV